MMTIIPALLITFLGLAVLIFTTVISFRKYGIKKYWVSFGIGHLLFIVIMSCIYYFGINDAQHQLFWILPSIVDLPASILAEILSPSSMALFVVLLATLGSLQYAAIGWCIDYKFSRDRKSLLPTRRFIVVSVIVFFGLVYWTYSSVSYLRLPDYEKAEIQLKQAKNDFEKGMALTDAAKSYFKFKKYANARIHAEQLLSLSNSNKNDSNIYGPGIYDSHIILGRLELLKGDSEKAIYHLFEAAKTPGHPTLASFGPDMSLAKDLLEKSYKEPVIEFLTDCKRFWTYNDGKLDKWIKEITEGKMPDFGMNLRV
jgi:tetratricopeptide (TPR) repeat protein